MKKTRRLGKTDAMVKMIINELDSGKTSFFLVTHYPKDFKRRLENYGVETQYEAVYQTHKLVGPYRVLLNEPILKGYNFTKL